MYQIKLIRVLSLLIMATAAAVSYSTQRQLFLDWSVDAFTAGVAPIAVDLLAIIATLAVHTAGVARKGRRAAIVVLVLTGSASTAANFLAGQTTGSKVVHASMVVLYLMAEWIAAQVRDSETPHNAPTSPGMPALIVDRPEEIAFREAQAQLRRESRLPALNRPE
jgi:hypothetical protein